MSEVSVGDAADLGGVGVSEDDRRGLRFRRWEACVSPGLT